MEDVPESTVNPSQPLVVSSTLRKEAGEVSPAEQFLQSEVEDKLADNSPLQSHEQASNPHPEALHSISTDNSREMTGPSYSVPVAHPQFRYYSAGFQPPMITHDYQAQATSSVPPLANVVYDSYSNPRYPPMYYSPFIPQYPPHTIPVVQLPQPQGTYFYTPGYPHPYPQNPSLATTTPPNAPRQQPQFHAPLPPARHPVAQFVPSHITNALVPQAGPHPMQPSFSHPACTPSIEKLPQQSQLMPFRYIRRHSYPARNIPAWARTSDLELLQLPHSEWAQITRGDDQSGGQIATSITTTPASNISIHLNSLTYSLLGYGGSSMQVATTSASSLPTTGTAGTHPALPRGPPRKPRKSGHALWVGNLPSWTNVIELKDYFSRGATSEIESVFLISKSNCAFVNYKTDAACTEAMARFHDSRFKGVRLVCRLRRNSAGPSSPSGATTNRDGPATAEGTVDEEVQGEGQVTTGIEAIEGAEVKEHNTRDKQKDRIFILKSLTVEDLDLSVKNGVWATQSHNEEMLNRAFETSENIYLIFSANKSGEYYGYARMTSRIPEGDADESEGHTTSSNSAMLQSIAAGGGLPLPKAILTPATATAPEGRIIDDSARGTIFWEAMNEELVGDDAAVYKSEELMAVAKSWGKSFNVQWISTTKLPFYRTRGLKNSWNSNREVKIARDGTEVEENVGKKLLQMFHRLGAGSASGELIDRLPESSASN